MKWDSVTPVEVISKETEEPPPDPPMAKVGVVPSQPSSKKVFDIKEATTDDVDADPLLSKLKQWDINGDGHFSAQEVLAAAREVGMAEVARKQAETTTRRMTLIAAALGFLLTISLGANLASTLFAISLSKEDDVPEDSGVMLTRPWNSSGEAPPPHPVGTANIKLEVTGISGLKEATKEELDSLDDISFYHDGGYHRLIVSQVHRYDGRVEVWGSPFGVLAVEDTGEVHYLPYGLPGDTFDECWGENSTQDSEDQCGHTVDNEPPSNLEVEQPKESDPENENAPPGARRLQAVTKDGKPIYEEDNEMMAEARRLSSRRRSGGSSRRRASSSRRRSGGSSSSRRRSSGGYSSTSSTPVKSDARRRSTTVGSSSGAGRRRVPAKADGSSRRRYPNYYNAPTESRRRSVSGSTLAAGGAGLAVGAVGGAAVAGAANSNSGGGTTVVVAGGQPGYGQPGYVQPSIGGGYYAGQGGVYTQSSSTVSISTCPHNMHQVCNGVSCWCEENVSTAMTAWSVLVTIGTICFCCCLCAMMKLATN